MIIHDFNIKQNKNKKIKTVVVNNFNYLFFVLVSHTWKVFHAKGISNFTCCKHQIKIIQTLINIYETTLLAIK